MPKTTGLGMGYAIDGIDLSGDINSLGKMSGGPAATQDMTGIDKSAHERVGLLRDGMIDLVSYFNPSAGQAHPKYSALPTTDVVQSVWFNALMGGPALGMVGKQTEYSPKRQKDGALLCDVKTICNGFGLEWGQQLTLAKRSDTTATNGASYDYGATIGTTAFGLQLYYQLFSFTGTSVTIKIQSSTDDGGGDAFADITGATTGALSAVGAGRVATATNASIERYLRVVTTGTFTQATFHVIAVRNLAAPAF